MSQQGDTTRHQGQEDEWWRQLYGGPADPPASAAEDPGDTVDDRYASALGALGEAPPQVPSQASPQTSPQAPPQASPQAPPHIPAQAPFREPPDTLHLRRDPAEPTTSGEGEVNWPAPPGLPPGWAAAEPPFQEPEPEPEPVHVGDRPPTYDAEPTAWPPADPENLGDLVPDTVLDGARYGSLTVRTASVRGDSARYRGEPRRDSLLAARFGTGDDALLLLAVASGPRAAEAAHRAAADACHWIAGAVGRSHVRLAEDIRASRRGSLKSGLHRLTDRCYGRLRARGADLGLDPAEYSAALRCLLLPVDPACRTRLFFGAGDGGLFRIRDGEWQDLDPAPGEGDPADAVEPEPQDRIPGNPGEPAIRFRFRASVARPGDTLLLCSGGLAEPLRGEPALAAHLVRRWGSAEPPGLAAFLGDAQTRVKGYADDRTAVAVWDGEVSRGTP
jgi:hypothetical protein